MMETFEITISPTAFSLLLYENMKSEYEQEGLLLGTLIEKEVRTITDNDQKQLTISRNVKVNGCIPFSTTCSFYDNAGRVDKEKIDNLCGELKSKVIGWYKFRSTPTFSFTLRDKIIHKQLASMFNLSIQHFVCCLLVNDKSETNSTHSYSQKFIRYNNPQYDEMPFKIINLNMQTKSYKSPEPVSETFNSITRDLNIDLRESQGLTVINKIQNSLQKHTTQMVKNIIKSEERIAELEKEIKRIQVQKRKSKLDGEVISEKCDNNKSINSNYAKAVSESNQTIKNTGSQIGSNNRTIKKAQPKKRK